MFEPMNRKVGQFSESGLAQKLVDDSRSIDKHIDDKGPKVLTLEHLGACFYVWLACVAVAVVAFVAEIFIEKIKILCKR